MVSAECFGPLVNCGETVQLQKKIRASLCADFVGIVYSV